MSTPPWRARAARPSTRSGTRNLLADPQITLQDGTESWAAVAREITGAERDEWWPRCVEAYPPYADYQVKTERLIPVLLLERVEG